MTRIEKAVIFALMFVLCGAVSAQQKKETAPKPTTTSANVKPPAPTQVSPDTQLPSQDFQNGIAELGALRDLIAHEQAALDVLNGRYDSIASQLQKLIPAGYEYVNGVFSKIKTKPTAVEPKK